MLTLVALPLSPTATTLLQFLTIFTVAIISQKEKRRRRKNKKMKKKKMKEEHHSRDIWSPHLLPVTAPAPSLPQHKEDYLLPCLRIQHCCPRSSPYPMLSMHLQPE
ncbi:hypothetical protein GW17_00055491 [Ensete ventricosum]|nr:hypothetical protein GW17_00055491 [Ensete ventricosum]RZS28479.1 hypothetical protein BHM03_00062082 [Ensete ventricosum]